jgi:pyruvate dehydrogenase phosphatase
LFIRNQDIFLTSIDCLTEFVSEGGLSSEAIKKAFESTEEEFVHLVKHSWHSLPKIASVGSCCLVGAITDDTLYVANLGDSRAVLGKRGSDGRRVVAERLSTDHNASTEEVRKELTALHPDDNHIVVHTRGVWRVKGIIQVFFKLLCGSFLKWVLVWLC